MAFIEALNLNFIDEVEFPRPNAYSNYHFGGINGINGLKGHALLDILKGYLRGLLDHRCRVKPLDFTNFTMWQLHTHYGVNHAQFWTNKIFFFHHFLGHPQKRNVDLTQRSDDPAAEWSVWKRVGRVASVKKGRKIVGKRTTYKLFEKTVDKPPRYVGYKLEVFRLLDKAYLQPERDGTKKSHWAIVRLSRC